MQNQQLDKFQQALIKGGIDQETAATLKDRLVDQISHDVMTKAKEELDEAIYAEIEQASDAEREEKLNAAFQEKLGMSVEDYRNQLTDYLVNEFLAA